MPCTLIRGRNTDRKGSSSGRSGARPAMDEAVKGASADLPMSREITFCVIIGEQMYQATPGASPYRNATRLPD